MLIKKPEGKAVKTGARVEKRLMSSTPMQVANGTAIRIWAEKSLGLFSDTRREACYVLPERK